MDPRADDVVAFWFALQPQQWFTKDPELDEEIRARFGALHEEAAAGVLAGWRGVPRQDLALVILLDQFPRNLFRGSPRAFATDAAALAIARSMDRSALAPLEQTIALLPYQHAEDLAVQEEGVAAYAALAARYPDNAKLTGSLDFAKRHRDIIARFGRFPHRNAVLGRASTPEELAFLETPGSSF